MQTRGKVQTKVYFFRLKESFSLTYFHTALEMKLKSIKNHVEERRMFHFWFCKSAFYNLHLKQRSLYGNKKGFQKLFNRFKTNYHQDWITFHYHFSEIIIFQNLSKLDQ
jgi:hypothetical protein